MAIVTMSPKGQIVLPREMRKALGLREGSRVRITQKGHQLIISSLASAPNQDWRIWRGRLAGTQALKDHLSEHAEEVERERLP